MSSELPLVPLPSTSLNMMVFDYTLIYGIQLLWPLFRSIQLVAADNQDMDKMYHLLSYWLMYFCLYLVETFTLVLPMVPAYYVLKSVVCLWMISETFQGSSFLFSMFVDKQWKAQESRVSPHLDKYFKDE